MANRGIRVAASFGALCAGALVLAACTGKVLSLGSNATQGAQQVAPSDVGGSVPACSAGSAHPNVCCTAGPNQAGSCVTYPNAPFTQCDPAATTYPDPRSCCTLDGSGNCSSPPPSGGGSSGGGSSGGSSGSSGGSCAYACPPGSYSMSSSFGNECCTTDSNGGTACSGSGPAGGSGGSSGGTPGSCSGVCSCPACPDDGGACPPCECPPPPTGCPATTCGACPPGWQAPQGAPDLCCTSDSSGNIECFSQAVPPGQSTPPSDGGSGPSGGGFCTGGGSTDGAVAPCSCQEQVGGHTYAVSCDPGTNLCTCTTDNGAPSSSFADNGNTCVDSAGLFTSCGFPL